MSTWGRDADAAQESEWVTYDERMEALIQLRSDSEDQRLSVEQRDEAYELAGKHAPSLDEWGQCRRIAERRHQISRERKIAKQQRPQGPLSVVTRPEPPKPVSDAGFVTPARAQRLLRAVLHTLDVGGEFPRFPLIPPARFVRTHYRYASRYWHAVEMERRRRRWMTAKGLAYFPRLAVYPEDLDQERPA